MTSAIQGKVPALMVEADHAGGEILLFVRVAYPEHGDRSALFFSTAQGRVFGLPSCPQLVTGSPYHEVPMHRLG